MLHFEDAAPDMFAVHMGTQLVGQAVETKISTGDEREFGIGEFVANGEPHRAPESFEHFGVSKINHAVIPFGMQNLSHFIQQRKHLASAAIRNILTQYQAKDMPGAILALARTASDDTIDEISGVKGDSFHAAEIDEPDSAIGLEQVISRMMVGMDRFQLVKLEIVKLDQMGANRVPDRLGRLRLEEFGHSKSFNERHGEHPVGSQVPMNSRDG